ncbi:hypothetical protein HK100_012105 [Physocladia obscura]|uniref:Uncharacterized protein n=1 Tax=Physocladia obscura TaxID=109957 RepID=A0AAD5T372_9FUNG|nr:hypothetical protein HK100_012105 [Physocladia obscura]
MLLLLLPLLGELSRVLTIRPVPVPTRTAVLGLNLDTSRLATAAVLFSLVEVGRVGGTGGIVGSVGWTAAALVLVGGGRTLNLELFLVLWLAQFVGGFVGFAQYEHAHGGFLKRHRVLGAAGAVILHLAVEEYGWLPFAGLPAASAFIGWLFSVTRLVFFGPTLSSSTSSASLLAARLYLCAALVFACFSFYSSPEVAVTVSPFLNSLYQAWLVTVFALENCPTNSLVSLVVFSAAALAIDPACAAMLWCCKIIQ